MRHAESYTSRRNSSEPNIYEEIGSTCYSEYGLPQMLQQQQPNAGQQGPPQGELRTRANVWRLTVNE